MELVNRPFLAPIMPKKGAGKMLDFDKAIKLVKENEGKEIYIGLAEDWLYTSGKVKANGRIGYDWDHEGPVCLASRWATPVIEIDDEVIECWKEDDGTVDSFNSEETWNRLYKKSL